MDHALACKRREEAKDTLMGHKRKFWRKVYRRLI